MPVAVSLRKHRVILKITLSWEKNLEPWQIEVGWWHSQHGFLWMQQYYLGHCNCMNFAFFAIITSVNIIPVPVRTKHCPTVVSNNQTDFRKACNKAQANGVCSTGKDCGIGMSFCIEWLMTTAVLLKLAPMLPLPLKTRADANIECDWSNFRMACAELLIMSAVSWEKLAPYLMSRSHVSCPRPKQVKCIINGVNKSQGTICTLYNSKSCIVIVQYALEDSCRRQE